MIVSALMSLHHWYKKTFLKDSKHPMATKSTQSLNFDIICHLKVHETLASEDFEEVESDLDQFLKHFVARGDIETKLGSVDSDCAQNGRKKEVSKFCIADSKCPQIEDEYVETLEDMLSDSLFPELLGSQDDQGENPRKSQRVPEDSFHILGVYFVQVCWVLKMMSLTLITY